jgi:two-component system, chemotaxis family, sensor kinase CheA
MPSQDDELLKRLLVTFKVEAQEHIETIASGLVELEQAPTEARQKSVLDTIFRSAHSLKGAARAVNVTDIEAVCQSLESVFASLKRREITPTPELFDLLHRSVDSLGQLLALIDSPASAAPARSRASDMVRALKDVLAGKPSVNLPLPAETPVEIPISSETIHAGEEEKRNVAGTVRVSTSKLDAVLLQAEEMLSAKQAGAQRVAKLRHVCHAPAEWKKKWSRVRPDLRSLQHSLQNKEERNGRGANGPQLERLMEFLEWSGDFIETLETNLGELAQTAAHDQRAVASMVDNLLDEMQKVVMQPFSTLLDIFPRLARELSREQGKEIELSIQGSDIEIDRRILEEMKDPLIHLARNCVDHGIETPAERTRNGKAARGTITLSVSAKNGSNVELLISDDGRGIHAEKVKAAAGKMRLLSPEKAESLSDKDALPFIFQSGVSTSPIITDISGRGLGLAIVKEKVEKLNGALSVETVPGKGTSFRIILPLTLARFHGVTVRVGEHLFVLPTSHVERVARVRRDEVKTVGNRETISLGGQAVALARLHAVLGVEEKTGADAPPDIFPVIVLTSANRRIAFQVDEILHEQEVLVKTLGRQLVRVRNIAGATVLGTGKVVPILNVPDLLHFAVQSSDAAMRAPSAVAEAADVKQKSILVAEDSITSRTLLKNILESAGYRVETSVDGVDAFTKLKSGKFDLVVSDVDMPRMNGFGLTAKIRGDKRYADLPVILVTALDSREDREHGIDVGASAYIVKSSFDQSNLLEIIRRSL